MDFKDRQREAMRLAARIESKAAEANSEAKIAGGKEWEANSEAKSAGGKEWEPEFWFFYRCHTSHSWGPTVNAKKMLTNIIHDTVDYRIYIIADISIPNQFL